MKQMSDQVLEKIAVHHSGLDRLLAAMLLDERRKAVNLKDRLQRAESKIKKLSPKE